MEYRSAIGKHPGTIVSQRTDMNTYLIQVAWRARYLTTIGLAAGCLFNGMRVEAAGEPSASGSDKYHFDQTMPREVLENYLKRS